MRNPNKLHNTRKTQLYKFINNPSLHKERQREKNLQCIYMKKKVQAISHESSSRNCKYKKTQHSFIKKLELVFSLSRGKQEILSKYFSGVGKSFSEMGNEE